MAILSFNGRIQIAIERIKPLYVDAQLLEAQGTASAGLIDHPSAIDHLSVVFRHRDALFVLEETGYGEFGSAVAADNTAWPGAALDWPIDMDLPDADRLKEQYGYTDPFASVALRVPHDAAWGNAAFVFSGNPQCPDVIVDAVTGTVRTHA